jgi:hypothetical protein
MNPFQTISVLPINQDIKKLTGNDNRSLVEKAYENRDNAAMVKAMSDKLKNNWGGEDKSAQVTLLNLYANGSDDDYKKYINLMSANTGVKVDIDMDNKKVNVQAPQWFIDSDEFKNNFMPILEAVKKLDVTDSEINNYLNKDFIPAMIATANTN